MKVHEVTEDSFSEIIETNTIVILDFWASWCGPCRAFAPVFEKVAQDNPDIFFGKINTEKETSLAQGFKIQAIPTLICLKNKTIFYNNAGVLPESGLVSLINEMKKLK